MRLMWNPDALIMKAAETNALLAAKLLSLRPYPTAALPLGATVVG